MPRNPTTGTYTLPAGYLATPNTPILSDAQHNDLFQDLQTVNNEAWPFGTSGGSIAADNGSPGLPSIAFASELGLGFYRVAAGYIGNSGVLVANTGYTTTATAAGTTTLTVLSTEYQYFTGATTQTLVMPVTSTLFLGWKRVIVNNSTGTITVNSSGSNLIVTVPPGATITVQCILLTGTTAASWNVLNIYAQGTFTPTLQFGGAAVGMTGTFTGRYTRNNNVITGQVSIVLTNKGSSTGNAVVGAFPFTSADSYPTSSVYFANISAGFIATVVAIINSGAATANLFTSGAASLAAMTNAAFSNTTQIIFSFSYTV